MAVARRVRPINLKGHHYDRAHKDQAAVLHEVTYCEDKPGYRWQRLSPSKSWKPAEPRTMKMRRKHCAHIHHDPQPCCDDFVLVSRGSPEIAG
jgi:hypothetical protein